MELGPCSRCGTRNPPGSRFCSHCGRPLAADAGAPTGPGLLSAWWPVDPSASLPGRDIRYVLIVLGIALVLVGILLLVAGAVISSALAAGASGCVGSGCASVDPGVWFEWFGLPLLVLGIGLVAAGILWALR